MRGSARTGAASRGRGDAGSPGWRCLCDHLRRPPARRRWRRPGRAGPGAPPGASCARRWPRTSPRRTAGASNRACSRSASWRCRAGTPLWRAGKGVGAPAGPRSESFGRSTGSRRPFSPKGASAHCFRGGGFRGGRLPRGRLRPLLPRGRRRGGLAAGRSPSPSPSRAGGSPWSCPPTCGRGWTRPCRSPDAARLDVRSCGTPRPTGAASGSRSRPSSGVSG